MIHRFFTPVLLAMILLSSGCQDNKTAVTSPDGEIRFEISMRDGAPVYSVSKGGDQVLENSAMGFTLKGEDAPMAFVNAELVSRDSKDETWEQVWGEDRYVRNRYNEMTVRLSEGGEAPRCLDVVVRVFDDGF